MYKRYVKRILDIILSVLCLPFFFFLCLFIAPIIFLTDRGPVFYCAARIGFHGQVFKMIKFRSMYVNSPDLRNSDNTTFNSEDDKRVTSIGRLMRKMSIDEVPQIINVLFGSMSFVGPRPNLYIEPYAQLPSIEQRRLDVRPGITGYNQVNYRNSNSKQERFQQDLYYVNNISFTLDCNIFFNTFLSVVKKTNVYTYENAVVSTNELETKSVEKVLIQ